MQKSLKNKSTWALATVLIAIEQIIKIVIHQFFFHEYLPIIPPFVYFSPLFNRDYSWLNSLFDLGVGKAAHIIITGIIILLIISVYLFISNTYKKNKLFHCSFAFLFAGSMCSFIDKVFWDGSLDYIQLTGLFTFDLKDVYLNIAIGLAILLMILKRKQINQINESEFAKAYWNFITKKIRKGKKLKEDLYTKEEMNLLKK